MVISSQNIIVQRDPYLVCLSEKNEMRKNSVKLMFFQKSRQTDGYSINHDAL